MLPLYNKEIAVFGFFEADWLRRPTKVSVWYEMRILVLIRHSVRDVCGHPKSGLVGPADRHGGGRDGLSPVAAALRIFLFIPGVKASCDSASR
jgi:hypothetical protein